MELANLKMELSLAWITWKNCKYYELGRIGVCWERGMTGTF